MTSGSHTSLSQESWSCMTLVSYQSFCTDMNVGQSPRWMHAGLTLLINGVWEHYLESNAPFVRNEEVRRITKQPNLTAIIQSRRLSIFGTLHMWMMTQMPNGSPTREVEETTRASPYHVQWDPRAYNLTLNEAADLAQNRPLWRLMSTCGATHF